MINFIKKYKLTILVIVFIGLIIGGYFGYKYYINNIGEYNPYSKIQDLQIVNYNTNQYTLINKDEIDVYRAYYKEFMQLMADDPAKAYTKLTNDTKTSLYNDNYDNFLNYQKTLDKKILKTSDLSQYTREDNMIYVVDKYNNHYVFYENGVWNYTVKLYK
ncbi:MAG: hypothetical protein IKP76_01170 [Bacilli bacterium]|nr:hypothetical protein [Bacilli bacterium]